MQRLYIPKGAGDWADRLAPPTDEELDNARELFEAANCRLLLAHVQAEFERELADASLPELAVEAEKVVDLYHRTNTDPELASHAVQPHAKAVLNLLLKHQAPDNEVFSENIQFNQSGERIGVSDPVPREKKSAQRIAYSLVKGAAVALKFTDTGLANTGLAAQIDFPPHLGQPKPKL